MMLWLLSRMAQPPSSHSIAWRGRPSFQVGFCRRICRDDIIGARGGILVRRVGNILDLDCLEAALGDSQRVRSVITPAPPYWHVVLGAKLLQELLFQQPVDYLLRGTSL